GSGSDGEFRVTDRRRRAEADTSAATPPTAEVQPPAAEEPELRRAPPEALDDDAAPPGGDGERSLEGLFVMLASSAVVALGEAADTVTGRAGRDPEAAADAIDLLVLLREKTEGNRTPRETQLLEELIYDPQLRYGAAMKPRL